MNEGVHEMNKTYKYKKFQENRDETEKAKNLKQILHYLEVHLQDQDEHLASQDRVLENLTKGD